MKDMLEQILQIEKKYTELGITLSDPAVIQDYNKFKELSKQRKSMEETVNLYYEWKKAVDAIEDAKELLHSESDEEMKEFLKSDIAENEAKLPDFEERMKVLLLPRDPMDDKDIMLEIRGGAGGDEANIFAGDLARMYMRYADKQGWQTQILSKTECEAGGVSEIIISMKGDSIYSKLKYESGVHRVQRVPATESQGRVHTSTATVAVMPEVDDVEVNLNMNDVEITTARSGKVPLSPAIESRTPVIFSVQSRSSSAAYFCTGVADAGITMVAVPSAETMGVVHPAAGSAAAKAESPNITMFLVILPSCLSVTIGFIGMYYTIILSRLPVRIGDTMLSRIGMFLTWKMSRIGMFVAWKMSRIGMF